MVALKAELGPFIPGVPGISGPSWEVFVAAGSDALPGTGTALGTFEHNSASDPYDKGLNHVVIHHIQDLLYRRQKNLPSNVTPPAVAPPVTPYTGALPPSMFPYGFTDLSVIKMKRHGSTMLSTSMTGAAVTVVAAATVPIVLKGQPGDTAIVNADVNFSSNNVAIATVDAAGVVTGVAAGSTTIHCVNKYNMLTVDVGVTVTAAELGLEEGRARNDDERSDNPRVPAKKENKDLPKDARSQEKERDAEDEKHAEEVRKAEADREKARDEDTDQVRDERNHKELKNQNPNHKEPGDPRLSRLGAKPVIEDDDDDEDDGQGGKRKKAKK